jgi:hypothetical protein
MKGAAVRLRDMAMWLATQSILISVGLALALHLSYIFMVLLGLFMAVSHALILHFIARHGWSDARW